MNIHPNNTLAQYITNLPRRIRLYGEWECGLTEIHYPHDWYNVRNARMVVEHEESVHNVYLDDGYYDSPETLVEALNLDKPSRVKFSYDSVTQKESARALDEADEVQVVRRCERYSGIQQHHIGCGSFDYAPSQLRRRFEARFRITLRLLEHGRTPRSRQQDRSAVANSTHNGKTRRNGDDAFRSRAVYARDESRVWNDRNGDKGRHWPTGAIRAGKGDSDTTLSPAQHWPIQMNYDDYYARKVGGALSYFSGARVQKGHVSEVYSVVSSDQSRR